MTKDKIKYGKITYDNLKEWNKQKLKEISDNFKEILDNIKIESWNSALQKAQDQIPNSSDLEFRGNHKIFAMLEGLKKK